MIARKHLVAAGLAGLAVLAAAVCGQDLSIRAGQEKKKLDQDKAPDLTGAAYYGVSACNICHAPEGNPRKWATDFVLMNEYTTWRTKDRHALAYVVLEGPRGRQIGKLLGINAPKNPQCLNCHATASRHDRQNEDDSFLDGVSCEGCHGPAERWIGDHAFKSKIWRRMSPEEKEALGMYDVRNPTKRTQLCASCHVGNAAEGKVVTHAMYAAGHPPLPSFEAASFAKNMSPHWRDAKDVEFFQKADAKIRKQNYADDADFQHTKLVLATCGESLRAMMELLASRATFDGNAPAQRHAWPPPWLRPLAKNAPLDRWPELPAGTKEAKADELQTLWPEIAMAQADCYACHHDLKSPSWRQMRGYSGRPGRPQLQPWPFALAPIALSADDGDFAAKLKKLTQAFDAQPFGIPKDVAAAALDLAPAADKMLSPTMTIQRETAEKLLKALLTRGASDLRDYDSARQIAWATRVVFSEWNNKQPGPEREAAEAGIAKIFAELETDLSLSRNADAREKLVKELLKDPAKSPKDFAAQVQDQKFLAGLQKISDEELASSLVRLNEYDPSKFKTQMKNLRELIFEKGAKGKGPR